MFASCLCASAKGSLSTALFCNFLSALLWIGMVMRTDARAEVPERTEAPRSSNTFSFLYDHMCRPTYAPSCWKHCQLKPNTSIHLSLYTWTDTLLPCSSSLFFFPREEVYIPISPREVTCVNESPPARAHTYVRTIASLFISLYRDLRRCKHQHKMSWRTVKINTEMYWEDLTQYADTSANHSTRISLRSIRS